MIHINKRKALSLLRKAVRGNEDFVHPPKCVYVKAGTPSCLIGQALFSAGVPLAELERFDRAYNGGGTPIRKAHSEEFYLTSEARRIFAIAQGEQDSAATWGQALAEAENVAAHPAKKS